MKCELHSAKSFRKDYKKLSKSEVEDTDNVIKKLLNNEPLEQKYNDHDLHGNYEGYRECHVRPDLLLVYKRLLVNCLFLQFIESILIQIFLTSIKAKRGDILDLFDDFVIEQV